MVLCRLCVMNMVLSMVLLALIIVSYLDSLGAVNNNTYTKKQLQSLFRYCPFISQSKRKRSNKGWKDSLWRNGYILIWATELNKSVVAHRYSALWKKLGLSS